MHVQIKSEQTGNAWWPVCPATEEFSFEHNAQYKVFGVIYSADTTAFRDKWHEATVLTTWDTINK